MTLARLVRGEVLSLREREFVQAARVIGVPTRRILFKELLPNLIAPIIVSISLGLPAFVTAEAGLAYLGIGVVGVPLVGPDDQQGRELLQHLPALPLRAGAGDPPPRHGAEPPGRRRARRLRPQDSPVITPAERASTSRERWVHLDAYEETSRGSCHSCPDDARCLWWWQRERQQPERQRDPGRRRVATPVRSRTPTRRLPSPSRTTPPRGAPSRCSPTRCPSTLDPTQAYYTDSTAILSDLVHPLADAVRVRRGLQRHAADPGHGDRPRPSDRGQQGVDLHAA